MSSWTPKAMKIPVHLAIFRRDYYLILRSMKFAPFRLNLFLNWPKKTHLWIFRNNLEPFRNISGSPVTILSVIIKYFYNITMCFVLCSIRYKSEGNVLYAIIRTYYLPLVLERRNDSVKKS